MVMFEAGGGPLLVAPEALPGSPPAGTPWPDEEYEPLLVPGPLEPVLDDVEPAGPIAVPGIAGPASPGYITVAPMPVITSGRSSAPCLA